MSQETTPLTAREYARMANELEALAATIKAHPEMNHHFAERLALIARQMREDIVRIFPEISDRAKEA